MSEAESDLLDPEFLARLGRLTLQTRRRFHGDPGGERRSPRQGSGLEFAGHRGYVAGDDLRHLDWSLLGRLDRPFIKVYQQDADVTVHLLLDVSRSMGFGRPSKLLASARLAAAVGHMALSSLDRVAAGLFDGDGLRVHGPGRGRGALFPLLRFLQGVRAEGPAGMAKGLRLHAAAAKPGLTVIFSDFFDPRFRDILRPHQARGHAIVLVQMLSPEEIDPPFDGDLEMEDAETGERVELTIGSRERAAYLARLEGHREELRRMSLRHGMDFVPLRSDVPVEDAVWGHLLRATILAGPCGRPVTARPGTSG